MLSYKYRVNFCAPLTAKVKREYSHEDSEFLHRLQVTDDLSAVLWGRPESVDKFIVLAPALSQKQPQ